MCEDTLQRPLEGQSAVAWPAQDSAGPVSFHPPGLYRGIFPHPSEQFGTPIFLWGEHRDVFLTHSQP